MEVGWSEYWCIPLYNRIRKSNFKFDFQFRLIEFQIRFIEFQIRFIESRVSIFEISSKFIHLTTNSLGNMLSCNTKPQLCLKNQQLWFSRILQGFRRPITVFYAIGRIFVLSQISSNWSYLGVVWYEYCFLTLVTYQFGYFPRVFNSIYLNIEFQIRFYQQIR